MFIFRYSHYNLCFCSLITNFWSDTKSRSTCTEKHSMFCLQFADNLTHQVFKSVMFFFSRRKINTFLTLYFFLKKLNFLFFVFVDGPQTVLHFDEMQTKWHLCINNLLMTSFHLSIIMNRKKRQSTSVFRHSVYKTFFPICKCQDSLAVTLFWNSCLFEVKVWQNKWTTFRAQSPTNSRPLAQPRRHQYSCRAAEDKGPSRVEANTFNPSRFHVSISARLLKIKEWVDGHDPGALVIPFSGGLESQLQDKSEEEMQKYCAECKTQRLISIQSPRTLLSAVSSVHSFNCMCW